ncbi:DUF3618 domain-containing protein [Haliea sp. E1-2-M8]|uniref:DUF3618 domain-containing protein n=1 Tax=Haliea sp. E1-2-M8 TaxID=3064706 RepID=UPI00272865F2|nr:DUF3618 domain-containing protein [Haliea sp. E1-2-M8]MDO8862452.1 DUF3618 domain-containing protein [Haliea sp. E1-2-M8]
MSNATDTSGDDTRHDKQHDETKSPERLEREVDQARARLGRTASELSDRLSPGELMDQALGMAREHGGEFGRNLGAQVKNNPIPMILTSVGISWMMMSSGNNGTAQTHRTHDTGTGSEGHGFKDALGNTAAKSRDAASAVGDRVHGATAHASESAQNARDSLVKFYRDQPLLAGSLGIAIGAALGALVPPTEMEDNMLGEARDRSVEAAKSEAVNKYDEVRESARSKSTT